MPLATAECLNPISVQLAGNPTAACAETKLLENLLYYGGLIRDYLSLAGLSNVCVSVDALPVALRDSPGTCSLRFAASSPLGDLLSFHLGNERPSRTDEPADGGIFEIV